MLAQCAPFFLLRQQVRVLLGISRCSDDFDISTFFGNTVGIDEQSRDMKYMPAVKFVPASVAVLKNSSKSRSCVMDWRRVESKSVVYFNRKRV